MDVTAAIDAFFRRTVPLADGEVLLVAFSGGPDSTALLSAAQNELAPRGVRVHAAHLDHGIDSGASRRAVAAAEIADNLTVPFSSGRRDVAKHMRPNESLETAARRIRYEYLDTIADTVGARYIATAHHAGDQVETVLLRLLYGSGFAGLSGIPEQRGRVVRPLLALPKSELVAHLRERNLKTVVDPTNFDLRIPRNLLRHQILPEITAADPAVEDQVLRLAKTAERATAVLDKRFQELLQPQPIDSGVRISRDRLSALPVTIAPHALRSMARNIDGARPTAAALSETIRQLRNEQRVGCDVGGGWRLDADAAWLRLARPRAPVPPFAYTLEVPGEVRLPDLSLVFRMRLGSVEEWMFEGRRRRAGLMAPLAPGSRVTVRNRRAGDRVFPLGCSYRRRLKEVFIDAKIPAGERDRLPLLCIGDKIVWIPGITIDHDHRIRRGATEPIWIVEIEPEDRQEP